MSLVELWRSALRRELEDAVVLRHELHARPRLSGDELDTAERLVEAIGCGPGRTVARTGRLVEIAQGPGRPVLLRTELDALAVLERTGVPWASGTGAMHACGHDVHMAALVAVCRASRGLDLPAPLLALLQPREEGVDSGAQDVVDEGGLEDVDAVIAAHVQPALPPRVIGVTPGPVNAGLDEFTITVRGRGGHSGYPHTVTDSVLALSAIVVALQQLGARRIDPVVGIACMVNQVRAGSGNNNVAPEHAVGSGTVRTMREEDRHRARDALRDITAHIAAAYGCTAEVEIAAGEPPLLNDRRLAVRAHGLLEAMGHEVRSDWRSFGSDDFANYGAHARALMVFVGAGEESGRLHDPTFLPEDSYVGLVGEALIAGYCAAADS